MDPVPSGRMILVPPVATPEPNSNHASPPAGAPTAVQSPPAGTPTAVQSPPAPPPPAGAVGSSSTTTTTNENQSSGTTGNWKGGLASCFGFPS